MTTAPSSIPRRGRVKGRNTSTLSRKPKKMASPPMRGMGWSCIRRPSLGTSTAPTRKARARTTGVVIRATTAAVSIAAVTVPTVERSNTII